MKKNPRVCQSKKIGEQLMKDFLKCFKVLIAIRVGCRIPKFAGHSIPSMIHWLAMPRIIA